VTSFTVIPAKAGTHCAVGLRRCDALPRVRFAYPGYKSESNVGSSFRWNDER